jgi:phosphate-selective porin OprO/OprP
LPGVDGFTNYNFEAAYMQGPFLLKGNYITRTNDAPTLGDPSYSASSIEAAWVVTGERQRYSISGGTFGQIRPKGPYGAFEIAARYSTIDLNDGLVVGGVEDNWTLGGNWYINRNLRVMVNYVNAKTQPGGNGQNEEANALIARFQIAY